MPLIVDGVSIREVFVDGTKIKSVVVDGIAVYVLHTVTVGVSGGSPGNTAYGFSKGGAYGSIDPIYYNGLEISTMALGDTGSTGTIDYVLFGFVGDHVATYPFASIIIEGFGELNINDSNNPDGVFPGAGGPARTVWTWSSFSAVPVPPEWDANGKTPTVFVVE
jgi:hypothetical protein